MWQYVAFIWHSMASFSTPPTSVISVILINRCHIFTANKSSKKHTAMGVSIHVIDWHIIAYSVLWIAPLNPIISLIIVISLFIVISFFLMQRNRYVITPQSSCEPVAVCGTVRGTFRCIWWYIFKYTSHCNQYYIRISPSDYPSRILSVALSFVRPMPIRLPNSCSEQPKRIVADSMIAV